MKCLTLATCIILGGCTTDKETYYVDNCTVDVVKGGQVLTCGPDQVVIPDMLPVTSVIDPCGDGPGVDEVMIQLQGDLYIAWYRPVGIVVLAKDIRYTTTDRQRCEFIIGINGLEEL